MPGDQLDLSSQPDPPPRAEGKRRFLGVQFACCGVYSRVYINREETAYIGNCPRCARQIRVGIAPGGVAARFFTAD